LYASDTNGLHNKKVLEVYTGSGFDSSIGSGTTLFNEDSHELNAIAPADLVGLDYIAITVNTTCIYGEYGDHTFWSSLKIQNQEVGGSYADDMGYIVIFYGGGDASGKTGTCIRWVHTLTAGEKTNGVQFKIFSKSEKDSTSNTGIALSNVQTIVEGV